jgi:nucleotide-binding universal stress UspA family protein
MNAPKSILLHVDHSPRTEQRLRVAGQLAEVFDAEVTALYAVSSIYPASPFAAPANVEAAAALRDIEEANRATARAAFAARDGTGARQMRWAECGFAAERAFARQARYADLMVLGQRELAEGARGCVPPDFVQWVLIESGRPGLVIPCIGSPQGSIGRTALVAWKNTREAAHAVSASLPFLRRCERVHVVSWRDDDEDDSNAPLDIEQYLHWHGVLSTMHRNADQPHDIGEVLLSMVADVGADLLVMGCYGHSRAREWVLGGVTRSVLGAMTVPVLMAH